MNITPTSIKYANSLGTKVAVYDIKQKKLVLIFKSMHLCAKYLYQAPGQTMKFTDLVNRLCRNKKTDDRNVFGIMLAFRVANDEQKATLLDADYLVLDEKFQNLSYKMNADYKEGRIIEDYNLEKVLAKGDLVKLKFGTLKGYVAEIQEVKDKDSYCTPGTKYYIIKVNGKNMDFKANVLSLVEKREFLPDED